ncbi:MAG TPA: ABC transporter permease [Anaerolineales bacterium]|nr:ABC transporter permease [Anaerolineales bacterium]
MNTLLTLATRYLMGRKLRTALTTLAVMFGVLVLFGMNIILPTMITALQANVQGASGLVDFSISQVSGEPFSQDILAKVQAVAGVRVAVGSLQRTINLPANYLDNAPDTPDRITSFQLIGVIPSEASQIRTFPVVEGTFLQESATQQAVISRTFADASAVKIGDELEIPSVSGVQPLQVVGILPPNTDPGGERVYVTLATAQKLVGSVGKINQIDVNLPAMADEATRETVQADIQSALGTSFSVGTLLSGTEMFASIQMAEAAFNLFGVLAFFMGGFIIFNTFRTLVVERRRDIGMLRSLGATRGHILGLVLVEGLVQGIVGTTGGLIVGYGLGALILRLAEAPLSQFINIQLGKPVVSPALLIVSSLLGVGTTLLAGLFPALSASRVAPLEALRPNTHMPQMRWQRGMGFILGGIFIVVSIFVLFTGNALWIVPCGFLFLIGLVLVAPALVQPLAVWFGRLLGWLYARQGTGTLAQSNLTRQPTRVAVTASATMLGLAVLVAAGGLVSSLTSTMFDVIRKSLGSDYLFVPPSIGVWGSNLGSGAEFAETLRTIPGVETVSALRYLPSSANGQVLTLLGIDPQAFPKVSGLSFQQSVVGNDDQSYATLANERALIVNGVFLSTVGAQVGDVIDLSTTEGTVSYRIVAVAADILNAKIVTAYISQANLQADFGDSADVFIQLNLKPGADVASTEQAIKTLAADYPQFNVIAGREYTDVMLNQMSAAFGAMYFLFAMLAIPSLIAMLNTLTIGVIERTREIGMLRAVGATRQQVRTIVTAEALLLAAIGAILGILGGLYLGYVLVLAMQAMFPMGYRFPVNGVIIALFVALLFGAIAAILPARQAARLRVVEALRYE